MQNAPAVETNGLRKSYGDVHALRGVDLHVATGSVFGLLGPNGAGKTTAVRILTTLLAPDDGSARVAGFDVVRDAAKVRQHIGLAGQYAAVDENLTGFENLEMVGKLYHLDRGHPRARAHELLASFDLADAGDRLVRTYSGGMRRRLDLAAALVARPPVLFLDEPTTGLDIRSRIELWDAIEALVSEGTTVLLTTQVLDEADRLADRIAVIDQGLVIAEGTPGELKSQVGGERLDIHLCDEQRGEEAARRAGLDRQRSPVSRGWLRPRPGRPAPGDDCRRRSPARRRRDRDRRHLGQHADAGRRLPQADRARGRARARGSGGQGQVNSLRYGISDTLVLAKRSLLRIPRQPDLLVGFTIQPILFILLFVYVFGGAIKTPGFDYVDYLIPGIIVQSIVFGGFVTALGLADDLKKGLIDRFRSLPMTRSALLTGRTLGDVVTNSFQLVVMFSVGLLIGFNFSSSVGEVVAGILLLLLIGYAFSWVFAFIGLSASSPEAANAFGFTILFPVTFVSSAFVPVDSMPSWLQPIAEHNPFTYMVNAARALFLGIPAGNNVWLALVWTLGIIAVFAPLSAWKYRRVVTR